MWITMKKNCRTRSIKTDLDSARPTRDWLCRSQRTPGLRAGGGGGVALALVLIGFGE